MGENQEENAIVTSTGEYVVAWDFNKVKKGHLDKYHIKKWVFSLVSALVADEPCTGTRIVWFKTTLSSETTRRSYVSTLRKNGLEPADIGHSRTDRGPAK